MKILVSGATGFLGGHLARFLVNDGHEVTALGRNEMRGRDLVKQGVRFVQADLAEEEALASACSGQEAAVHCAGLSAPHASWREHHAANVLGTETLLSACLNAGVKRFIHISTSSVYFRMRHQFDLKETDLPARSATHYARSKRIAETKVEATAALGMDTVILRPRAIFGPGDTSIFPRLLRAHERGALPLFSKEPITVDVTYVDNLVEAISLCLEREHAFGGKSYNVTNGEPMELLDILETLFGALDIPLKCRRVPWSIGWIVGALGEAGSLVRPGREPLLTRFSAAQLAFSQTLNIDAMRDLGYRPRVDVATGLGRFAQWWRAHGAQAD